MASPLLRCFVENTIVSDLQGVPVLISAPAKESKAKGIQSQLSRSQDKATLSMSMIESGDLVPLPGHPFQRVISAENGDAPHDGHSLSWLTDASLEVHGEAFWLKVGSPMTSACFLKVEWIVRRPHEGYDNYYVVTDRDSFEVPSSEIVRFQSRPDFDNPYGGGFGAARSLGLELQTDRSSTEWFRNVSVNDGSSSGILVGPGLDSKRMKRFDEDMDRLTGPHGPTRPFGLDGAAGDYQFIQLSQGLRDAGAIEQAQYIRDIVRVYYRIPREMVGDTDNTNRSTFAEARQFYAEHVLGPRLHVKCKLLQLLAAQEYDKRIVVAHAPATQYFREQSFNMLIKSGTGDVDEIRELAGMSPKGERDGGKMKVIPANVYHVEEYGDPPPGNQPVQTASDQLEKANNSQENQGE